MPHFNEDISEIVRQVPKDKLLILDIDVEKLDDTYAILYQDFEENFYHGLYQALPMIQQYKSLTLFLNGTRGFVIAGGVFSAETIVALVLQVARGVDVAHLNARVKEAITIQCAC